MAKVLILEDETIIGAHLEMILERASHTVVGVCGTCAGALDTIDRSPPDVAILDVSLRSSGTSQEVAEKLHELGIPFLFLSGRPPEAVPALKRFANAPWVSKPTDARRLVTTLERLLHA